MDQGLSAFGIRDVEPAAQFYAPQTASAAYVPQYTSPILPAPISYAPQAQSTDAATPDMPEAAPHPPSFMDYLSYVERKNGKQLDPDAFDNLVSEYRTNIAAPALNRQKGTKKALVDSELAAFDNHVAQLRASRYGNGADQSRQGSTVGDFLKSAGQQFGSSMGPGLAAYAARLGGGIASAGGLAPNSLSDALLHQASPIQSDNKTDAQAGQDFARLIMGANYDDPNHAALRQKLVEQGAAQHAATNTTTAGGLDQRWSEAAQQRSPLGAATGDIVSMLTQFLLTRRIPTPALAANASLGARIADFLPSAAAVANRTATDTAAQNVNRGDDLSHIMQQLAADQALSTAFNLMPGNLSGGLLRRAGSGALIGAAQTGVQGVTDQALNPNNKGFTSESLLTNAGFQAALAAILGAHGAPKGQGAPKPTEAPAARASEAPTPEPSPAGAAQAPAASEAAPVDFRADAAQQPLESAQFTKLQSAILDKANTQSKKYKTAIANADTPEKVVERATQFAQRFTGDNWAKLDADQRMQTIETMAAWLGKRNKIKLDDIQPQLETLRNPPATEATPTPTITEQPLPADITGQQVPGTVAQEAAPATQEAPTYTPDKRFDTLWDAVNNPNHEALTPTMQMLRAAMEAGKIKDRQQFDDILAQAAAKKANPLKAQPKAPDSESVAKTVTEALTDSSTPETQRNKLKAKAKQLTEKQYNQGYLRALMNRDNAPSADEAQFRQDPAFNSAAEAMRQGKITNPDELGLFLKEQKGTTTVGDQSNAIPDTQKNRQLGALLGDKSTKSETVKARKYGRQLLENLTKLGEKDNDIRKMTVTQAEAQLQKLANTFTSVEAPPKAKAGLKKANVKPVENPDEPPPTKPKKTLKKKTEPAKDKPQTARSLNKKKNEEAKAKIIDELKELGVEKDRYEGKSLKELYAIREVSRGSKAFKEAFNEQPASEKLDKPEIVEAQGRAPMDMVSAIQQATGFTAHTMTSSGGIARFMQHEKLGAWDYYKPGKLGKNALNISVGVNEKGVATIRRIESDRNGKTLSDTTTHEATGITVDNWQKKTTAFLKKLVNGETEAPKTEAPASESGRTPLETQLHGRFEALPHNVLDELHDAIAEAQIGDKGRLTDLVTGLREAGDINKDDAKWINGLAKEPIQHDFHENNASGESSASLEAQHRLADEKAAGQTRAIIRRDGTVEPLTGVDAVDTHARKGEVIAQRNVGKDDWTILSHGDDLSTEIARGKLNRAKEDLTSLHEHAGEDIPERSGEHTLNLDDFEAIQFDRTRKVKSEPLDAVDRVTPIQTSRRIDKIIKNIQEGADVHETGRELQRLRNELENNRTQKKFKQAFRDRRRGVEWVRAKLQRMVADYPEGSDHARTAKFGLWLLEHSPHLADNLGISLREIENWSAGSFNPLARIVSINSTSTNPKSAVHEIMHASEQLLPKEIQDKIRGEYIGRLQNKLKQQIKADNRWTQLYLRTAIKNFASPSDYNRRVMMEILKTHRKEVPADDYYKYFDPSEYWAVESTDVLNRRHENDSWIGKAKEWMNGFVQQVKSLLKLDSNNAIYKGLNEVLRERIDNQDNPKSEQLNKSNDVAKDVLSEEQVGEDPSDKELGYETSKAADVDPNMQKELPKIKDSQPSLSDVTTAQRAIEQTMRADYGLEKAMQEMRRKGVKLTTENNVEDAAFRRNGLISEYNNKDFDEAFNPADDWVTTNYAKHAKNKQEFVEKLNKFFQNTHWLERVKTDWLLESPLKGEAELDRADLLERVREGDIDPVKASKELNALVAKNATTSWEEWGRRNSVPMDTIKEQLAKLDIESGINQKSMAELNGLMDLARNRATERLQGAGLVDKNDPWVKFYNWKWYVPLKGSAYGEGASDNNFDLIPTRRIALARLSKQMQVMEGRRNFAEKPFTRLFVDMARAGERQATAETVMDATYNLAVDHPKEVGAEIHTFTGRPKDGYVNTKTGEYVERLKAPANGIIVNDGDTHHVIVLPEDSQLRRGLVQMNNVERPNALDRKVGKVTNVLARLYTTVHPGWQTFSGFIRDLSYIPVTVGATKFSNPLDAVPFFGKYGKNVLQAYRALPTLVPHLRGQGNKLRTMGEADPNSWAGWTRRYEAAGGSNAFTKGFDIAGMERLMRSHLKDVHGISDATKWGWEKTLEYTGNYANFLEAIGRVAGFKTLVEMGYSEPEAAVTVRKTLDYSQSGIKGRRINSWLAFFRVAMTGADAMRRAFTKPTGGLDYKKMAAWQGFMGALGSVGYMMGTLMLGQDQDGKDKISKIDPGLLTQKILFPVGDQVAGVNLGLGLPQVLMAPGILGAALAMNHIDAKTAIQVYTDTIARNGPISPAGTLGNNPQNFAASYILGFVPTAVRPLVDIDRNTTTFNSSIHTTQPNANKFNSDQGRFNTQQSFKDMARWLREATGGKVDMYPEDIRYLIQSYGGQWATDLVKTALTSPDEQAGGTPAPNRLAGKLLVDTSHYMQNEMYATLDNLNDSNRRYQSLVARAKDNGATDQQAKAQADQVVARDPQFRQELQAYKALNAARQDYQAKIKALKANKLVSDTRKQLERKRLDAQLRQAIERAQAVTE